MDEWKRLGNDAFASGQFKQAIDFYSQALAVFYQQTGISADPITRRLVVKEGAKNRMASGLNNLLANLLSCGGFSQSCADKGCTTLAGNGAESELLGSDPLCIEVTEEQLQQYQPQIVFSNRSAAHAQLDSFEEALQDAEYALRYSHNWPKAFFRKAEALFGLGRLEEALGYYQKANSLVSAVCDAHYHDISDTMQMYAQCINQRDPSMKLVHKRIQLITYQLEDSSAGVEIIQLLAGRDFAVSTWSPISKLVFNFAQSLQNFVYAIGCRQTRQCVLVDVCWDVNGILRRVVQKAGYQVVGTIVTHYHFDHVGGKPPAPYDRYHVNVDGLVVLLRRLSSIPVYIHPSDVAGVVESNPALPMDRVIRTDDGFELAVGQSVHIRFIHTPGHTPGSQCLLVNGCRLFSGDTLFISSIGRLDFPDSDSREMFNSMRKLRELDGDIMILPGHSYGGSFTTLAREKEENHALMSNSFQEFANGEGGY